MFTEKNLITAENYISVADFAITGNVSTFDIDKSTARKVLYRLGRPPYYLRRANKNGSKIVLEFPGKDEIIFFIKTDYLNYFLLNIRPYLKQKYKIITGYSDYSIPDGGAGDFTELLNDSLLDYWYGYNITMDHPKLKAAPLGIPPKIWLNLGNEAGDHRLFIDKLSSFSKNPISHKSKLIYWGSPGNTTDSRLTIYESIKKMDYVTITERKNYDGYLTDLSQHKFVICPEGNGIDTHRTWESMYFLAIPIIKKNYYMNLYRDVFPILYINEWSEVNDLTENFLNLFYTKMTFTNFKNKLRFEYWKNIIKNSMVQD